MWIPSGSEWYRILVIPSNVSKECVKGGWMAHAQCNINCVLMPYVKEQVIWGL